MGKRNRQRRAEKQRRQARKQRNSSGPAWSNWQAELDGLIDLAGRAAAQGDEDLDHYVAALVTSAQVVGKKALGVRVGEAISVMMEAALEGGWQPVEVARVVARGRTGDHREVAVTALADTLSPWLERWALDGRTLPEPWGTQIDTLGISRWWGPGADWLEPLALRKGMPWEQALAIAIDVFGLLLTLPCIEPLISPPSQWTSRAAQVGGLDPDDPVLEKVRALLAKAESTAFQAEAEALTAKAQELMARHAIDDAVTHAKAEVGAERPSARRLPVDDPYAEAKSHLLHVVADANSVPSVWHERFAMMTIVGFPADLDAVELLFTSLLVQATKAMLAKGSVTDGAGRSRTRSFRQSFLLAFAHRIHERLVMAATVARRQAEKDLGESLLPVLADRSHMVDEKLDAMFPHLVSKRGPSITNEAGWRAGRIAAELATLGPEQLTLLEHAQR